MTKRRILIVDDELDILRSTEMLLDRLGFECVVLPEASHVAEVAAKIKPDLIFQDLLMPGMDLAETVRRLRSDAYTRSIPIVFFSASADLAQTAAQYDAAGYLAKPFSEEELESVIKTAVAKREPVVAWGVKTTPGLIAQAGAIDVEGRGVQRQAVKDYFHDYWNTLTAINSYAHFLVASRNASPAEREAAAEIARLTLDLEGKTDALRSRLLEFVG